MDLTFVPQMLVLKLGENQDHPTLCCRFIMETSVLSGVSSSVERAVNCLWLFNSYMEATRLPCNCTELLLIYISSVDHHRDCSGLSVKMTSKPWVDHRHFCLTTENKRGNSENVCRLRAAWLALPPTERSTWRNGTELSLCFVFFSWQAAFYRWHLPAHVCGHSHSSREERWMLLVFFPPQGQLPFSLPWEQENVFEQIK